MINDFIFSMSTQIVFGNGVINQIGELTAELGGTKVMLVADKGVRATGLTEKVENSLKEKGIAVLNFDQIVPNPRIADCEAGAKIATEEKIDFLVAIGGGSSIDTAKAIAGMLGHGTVNLQDIIYPNQYTSDPYPLIAIPTTAGTGSEVTIFAVVTDEKTHTKMFCYDTKIAPTIALADPEVLMGLPTTIAASTGIDALTHAIEGYVCNCTSPLTEAFGLYAVKLIYENIRKYIYARDAASCEGMMIGSLLAGLSIGYADTAAIHSVAEIIGGRYDTPHGVANAIFLASITEFSIPAAIEKYASIARNLGIRDGGLSERETAQAGAEELRRLVKDLGIPDFNQLAGIKPDEFQKIAEECVTHMSCPDNPRPMAATDFLKILKDAYAV